MRRRLLRLLWAAPVALGVCYFALWACAPLLTHPAPVPIPDQRRNHLGAGGGYVAEISEATGGVCRDFEYGLCTGPEFAAFYRHDFGRVEFLVLAHGGISLVGAGVGVRGYPLQTETARVGLSGGLGWAYAQVGLPVAGRVAPGVWLYTEPTFALSTRSVPRVPLGLAFEVGRASIEVEGGGGVSVPGGAPFGYGSAAVGFSF